MSGDTINFTTQPQALRGVPRSFEADLEALQIELPVSPEAQKLRALTTSPFEADFVSSDADAEEDAKEAARDTHNLQKPALVASAGNPEPADLQDDLSLIAILGKIATLVTQQDTNFRQIMWDQDTEFMQFTVRMGATLHSTIMLQGEAQAKATEEDASMARKGGLAMVIAGGLGMVVGIAQAYSEMKGVGKVVTGKPVEEGTEMTTLGRRTTTVADPATVAGAPMSSRLSWAARAKKGFANVAMTVGQASKYVSGTLSAAELLAQGNKALFVDAPGNTNKAQYTREASKQEADKTQIETYQNFWNQSHQRGEQSVSGTDQNHANTLRTYSSAIDSSTQALVSGWNRI